MRISLKNESEASLPGIEMDNNPKEIAKERKGEIAKFARIDEAACRQVAIRSDFLFRVFAIARFRDDLMIMPQTPKNAIYEVLVVGDCNKMPCFSLKMSCVDANGQSQRRSAHAKAQPDVG
jgi:hypothetical protein